MGLRRRGRIFREWGGGWGGDGVGLGERGKGKREGKGGDAWVWSLRSMHVRYDELN